MFLQWKNSQALMFKQYDVVMTDLLVLSVLQPYRVVSHAQRRDDEVNQSKDAVEPQQAVPVSHKNTYCHFNA